MKKVILTIAIVAACATAVSCKNCGKKAAEAESTECCCDSTKCCCDDTTKCCCGDSTSCCGGCCTETVAE